MTDLRIIKIINENLENKIFQKEKVTLRFDYSGTIKFLEEEFEERILYLEEESENLKKQNEILSRIIEELEEERDNLL